MLYIDEKIKKTYYHINISITKIVNQWSSISFSDVMNDNSGVLNDCLYFLHERSQNSDCGQMPQRSLSLNDMNFGRKKRRREMPAF